MYINKHKWKEAIVFWDQKIDTSSDVDVFYLLHEIKKPTKGLVSEHLNFVTTLGSITPEDNFSSSTRRKWRKLSDIDYEMVSNITNEFIDHVVKEYNIFAKENSLTIISPELYRSINKDGKLFISFAKKNNCEEYFHTYYVAEKRARLFHSFPTSKNTDRNINVGLHRFDILYFTQQKLLKYDWGGAGFINEDDPKKMAIREYKRRFGGKEEIYYKTRISNSELGTEIVQKNYKIK